MGFKLSLTVLLSFLLTLSANAKIGDIQSIPFTVEENSHFETTSDPYYTVSEITIEEVYTPLEVYSHYTQMETASDPFAKIGKVIQTVGDLVALGTNIWKIVEKGKPVVTMDVNRKIDVVPLNEDKKPLHVFEMDNWSYPITKSYKVAYKNGFGSEVIKFTYTVFFQHGGKYNGAGDYLANVNITASNVHVKWGFDFNANSEFGGLTNIGTLNDPIAGVTFNINYTGSSVFSNVRSTNSFFVTGKGDLKILK